MMSFDFSDRKKNSLEYGAINSKILRQAQQSGSLNLAGRSLKSVPSSVWHLNAPLPPSDERIIVDFERPAGDARWWETQPLTRLTLASNQLTHLDGAGLLQLDSLTYLDVRDNQLTNLPEEIGELLSLKTFVLNANRLRQLPRSICRLRGLNHLDASNNQIECLPDELERLDHLEKLDLSNNHLLGLPDALPSQLRLLNLRSNRLMRIFPGILEMLSVLHTLDLSCNQFDSVVLDRRPPAERAASHLAVFHAHHNRLLAMPDLAGLTELKEVSVSDNRITSLPIQSIQGSPLMTLDLARNRLSELPDGLSVVLPALVRLDVSCNDLSSIPCDLGLLDSLRVLLADGNPLRSIRQSVISAGTESLKALLKQRYQPAAPTLLPPTERTMIDSRTLPSYRRSSSVSSARRFAQSGAATPNRNNSGRPAVIMPEATCARCCSAASVRCGSANGGISVSSTVPSAALVNVAAGGGDVGLNVGVSSGSGLTGIIGYRDSLPPPVGPTGILDWSCLPGRTDVAGAPIATLPPLDSEQDWMAASVMSGAAVAPAVKQLNLGGRMLAVFPQGIFAFAPTLVSLTLCNNNLSSLPDHIDGLYKLGTLDLSRNRLTTLPETLSHLSELTTLRLDCNPLGPDLPVNVILSGALAACIENLSVRSCQLRRVPPTDYLRTPRAPKLTRLDLSDNDIDFLPPDLGLCTQLRSLHVEGNSFRVPRPAIVARGTAAVLRYLRSRVAS